jgi:hypothetical protein
MNPVRRTISVDAVTTQVRFLEISRFAMIRCELPGSKQQVEVTTANSLYSIRAMSRKCKGKAIPTQDVEAHRVMRY